MENRKMLLPALLSMALVFSLILPASIMCAPFYRPSECDIGDWTDITQIAAGTWHTVGLKFDGTVVAAGDNHFGECDVGGWTNIIQVAAGGYHTVGVKTDGTVVAAGRNNGGCCEVGNWTGINQTANAMSAT